LGPSSFVIDVPVTHRFFVETPISSDTVSLTGSEAHHLAHVMRIPVDATVVLFDGTGSEFAACVTQIGSDAVRLQVHERRVIDRELPLPVTLAVPLPKGDRQRWLVEKAVELGVTRFIPLVTARSVVRPSSHTVGRLERTVIEASKQCGRNRLMQIGPPATLNQFLAGLPSDAQPVIAHPNGAALESVSRPCHALYLVVGPEGGLTDDEIRLAATIGQVVRLGPRVLRTETAAAALVAFFTLAIQ
jgi:16S rRNA (uracil1498-N3)-methyltransferase